MDKADVITRVWKEKEQKTARGESIANKCETLMGVGSEAQSPGKVLPKADMSWYVVCVQTLYTKPIFYYAW